jgi:hypothetical protein
VLADEGLTAAVEALGESGIGRMRLDAVGYHGAPREVETTAYLILRAAASANPTSEAVIRHEKSLMIVEARGGSAPKGIQELTDRVGALDGSLVVTHDDDGVRIRAAIPCR